MSSVSISSLNGVPNNIESHVPAGVVDQPRHHADAPSSRRERGRVRNENRESRAVLCQQLQSLRDANRILEEDRAALREVISALQNDKATFGRGQEVLAGEITALEAEREVISQEKLALEGENQALQNELTAARDQVSALEEVRSELTHEKSLLEERIQALEHDQQALASEKETPVDEKATLVDEKKTLANEKQTLEQDKETLTADNHLLAQQNTELQQEKAALEKQVQDVQDAHDRISGDNTRFRAAFDAQLEKTRARAEENRVLCTKIEALEEHVAVVEAAKREAENAVQTAQEENAQQAGVIAERDLELGQVRSRLDEFVDRNALLAAENARLRAEKEALEQEITPLQTKNDELTELNNGFQDRVLTLETEKKKLDTIVQDARRKLGKQEETVYAAVADLGKATGERDVMRLELSKEKESRRVLLGTLREEKAKSSNLETELSIAHALLSDTQTTNTQLTQTEVALKNKISRLQRTVTTLTETTDTFTTTERDLHAEISTLKTYLSTRDAQKKDLRTALKDAQKSVSDATDRVSTLETEAVAREHRLDSLRHRLDEEKRLRASVTHDLRGRRIKQKELEATLEALTESSAERIAEAERRASAAAERVEDLEREISSTKGVVGGLKVRLNDARVELIKCERRLAAEQEKWRVVRGELQEANRMIDELDPEKLYRQLSDEKVARATDVARLEAEVAAREGDLAKEKARTGKLSGRIKGLEENASHENCVERGQVKDLVKMIAELVAQCEVRPKTTQRYEYQYPQDLVRKGEENKWEIKFVRKCAVRRRW